jgi:uncharacterized protein (DUF58 family)
MRFLNPPPAENAIEERRRGHFFDRVWLAGAGICLFIGVLTRETSITLVGLLVLITAGLGALWNRYSLEGIEYKRTLDLDRAFPDDIVTMTITVTNRKPLPVPWLSIEDELADALEPTTRQTIVTRSTSRRMLSITTSLKPFERVSWKIPLHCKERGSHTLGPVTLRSADPFGFFSNRATLAIPNRVLVYPRIHQLPDLDLPPRFALGDTRVARHEITDPARVVGIRDYQPTDPFRSIHWKASARQGTLQVRIAEPTTTLTVAVFLNLDTFEHYWEGLDVVATERTIELAASLLNWANDRRYALGIYANGLLAGSDQPLRLAPGRGGAQLPAVLEGLAKLSPFSTLPFPALLRLSAKSIGFGSTIVVATPLVTDETITVLAELIRSGRRVVLAVEGDVAVPPLRGLIVRRVNSAALAGIAS